MSHRGGDRPKMAYGQGGDISLSIARLSIIPTSVPIASCSSFFRPSFLPFFPLPFVAHTPRPSRESMAARPRWLYVPETFWGAKAVSPSRFGRDASRSSACGVFPLKKSACIPFNGIAAQPHLPSPTPRRLHERSLLCSAVPCAANESLVYGSFRPVLTIPLPTFSRG
jgi:hypothetical protein